LSVIPMIFFSSRALIVFRNPLHFVSGVFRSFYHNKGFLLASAVAYNTLLSIIPILALTAIGLSQWLPTEQVFQAARNFLELIAPMQVDPVLNQLSSFMAKSGVIGVIGAVTLIFFSALAFSALEGALTVIFTGKDIPSQRKAWVSWVLPYAFVLVIGVSIFAFTLLTGAFETVSSYKYLHWLPQPSLLTAAIGFVGEVLMFAAIYFVLPPVPVSLKHAIVGGVAAAILWEMMRRLLVWYFVNLSSLNIIYGTFATALVIILSLEVAVTILLLGAQVIHEYSVIDASD